MGILIVEKDNVSAELIYEIFIKEVKDLLFVNDGTQALIAFRKYKISLIIVDLEISFVNPFDLIQIMKNENPNIKIIALKSNTNICKNDKYCFDILIQKNQINDHLYDSYLEIKNEFVF